MGPKSIATILVCAISLASCGVTLPWITDIDQALDTAKREDKDVLLLFTGSDWCTDCFGLEELLHTEGFRDYARDRYVLVLLDFPHPTGDTIRAMPYELQRRNADERIAFGVDTYPTVVFLTHQGVELGRLVAAEAETADEFVTLVDNIVRGTDGRDRASLLDTVSAGGDDDARLAAARSLVGHVCSRRLFELLDLIETLDAQGDDDAVPSWRENFAKEHLDIAVSALLFEEDWELFGRALDDLVSEHPAAERLAGYHVHRAAAWVRLGHLDRARASLDRVRGDPDAEVSIALIEEKIAALEQ